MPPSLRLFCFLSLFTLGMNAVPAQAGVLEFFFPSLRNEGPTPAETLRAPFADGDAAQTDTQATTETETAQKAPSPDDAIPLEKPHRAASIIADWVTTKTSDVINFTSADYKQDLENTKSLFESNGRTQYEAFLKNTKIMNVLESGRYKIHGYVRDIPLLLNQGAVQGRYRWLYEIPVMISYMPQNTTDYEKLEPVNQNLVLRIQVGRAADAQTDLKLLIETWSGKAQKLDKK